MIEKVKAELKRRMEIYKNHGGFFTGCIGPNASAIDYYYAEDEALLLFIETLEREMKQLEPKNAE